jgi:hypothetical protein
MTSAVEKETTRNTSTFLRLSVFSSVAAGLVALGIGVGHFNAPLPDHTCSARHATIRDADGRTMWCNRMAETLRLAWQYTPEQ